jgi:hypothetical protein
MKASKLAFWLRDEWRWLAACILIGHTLLALVYSVATPIWEGPDELGHYRHVRFLARNLSLPEPEDSTTALDQLTHPPAYYALTGLLTAWVDTGDNLKPVVNPFAATGTMEGGANQFVHFAAEGFPYRGTALAVHLARSISVLLGTLVVLITHRLGRVLFPNRHDVALGAMAINAFVPGFLFMSSVINNDIMVTLFGSLILLFSVRILLRGPSLKALLALGTCTGLAVLSKYNALALVPIVAICVVLAVIKVLRGKESLRLALLGTSVLLISALAVSSWWFLRSLALFGTPTTRSAKIISRFLADISDPGTGLRSMRWQLLPEGLSYFYKSFWASFGWGNIMAESWVYLFMGILTLAGFAGFALFLFCRASRSVKAAVSLLLLAFVLFSLLAIYRTLVVGDPVLRGRYALPAISGVSVLISLGVVQITPRRLGRLPILCVGCFMAAIGLIAPFRYIMPVYALPPLIPAEQAAQEAVPLGYQFGDEMELLGYRVEVDRTRVGESVPITLYWRRLSAMEQNYTVALTVLDPDGDPHGQVATFPGRGNYATSLWDGGEVVKDTYHVRVAPTYPAPGLIRFYVAVYTYPRGDHLAVLDSTGEQIGNAAIFGRLPVQQAERTQYEVQNSLQYELGDRVALIGYDLDDRMLDTGYACFTLYWRALDEMTQGYTVFVHVLDEHDQIVAQSDGPPHGGFYPTSYWQEGESVPDEHCISLDRNLPLGTYRVVAGMYLLETMQRLPVFDEEGRRVPSDRCFVLEWKLTSPRTRTLVPLVLR